ncbi:MAG TPA: carboxypeptidase regulatory-like domain-containing protein [Terriglobales bacterium]|nr:carboxypeptidase regulatory-like domain-containing protein [Terriglobales bacterium]
MLASYKKSLYAVFIGVACVAVCVSAKAQSGGNSTSVNGTVADPSGSVVVNAIVEIHNPVSHFDRTISTDSAGKFSFTNVPFNPYHLTVKSPGFATYAQDIDVRSVVPVNLSVGLQVKVSSEEVTVESTAQDLLENEPTFHTDVDRELFDKLPLESESSSVSSLVTEATPGIAADSNGLFHGLGDHAENSFSVDGQPITDQQSKVFSNQIPLDSVQSMEVISGAPPAEYGDKTSVVINVTTRSGQGITTPTGAITTSYGTFGSSNVAFNLAYGGQNWGNFIALSGLNSGRFLDPPEFTVMHDKGNEENAFDRIDYQLSPGDSLHLNLSFTRSWFQTPNSFDSEDATPWKGVVVNDGGIGPNGLPVGPADQRSQIKTFNIAPSWVRLISNTTVFTLGAYVRRDQYNYYPSANPFADLGPVTLQRETVGQDRNLTNGGLHSDFSYVKGVHNLKLGATYEQTFLNENDNLGIVDPTLNDPTSPSYNPVLAPYDLTRGGHLFAFNGHTDVKELALYVDDAITAGNWNFRVGVRSDFYNGLTTHKEGEPRLGLAYNVKKTNTILRLSYARTLETPFNENLVLSSIGCSNPVLNPLLGCTSTALTDLSPGWRNEFHAGIQQALGKYLVFSGEYIWKYTHNGFDFSVLGNTPITFPVEWDRSKIPGFAGRVSVPNFHGFSALAVFSSVAARFFLPQVGGAGATPTAPTGVFRIDHDEHFNQTTHLQYQPWQRGPWLGFNWRYDSGLVAGAAPCYGVGPSNDCPGSVLINGVPNVSMIAPNVASLPLSADQEFEAGFFCGTQHATPTQALPFNCPASQFGSTLIKVPAPGAENDDHNPPRIAPRHLFDLSIGHDNLFHGDKYKWSAQFTVINLANNYALYNFLSTFSGTHYVTPRTLTGQIGFNF